MNINNRHIFDLIPDYLDGLLEGKLKEDFETHLESCSDCRCALEEMKHLYSAITAEPKAIPSSNLERAFESELQKEIERTSKYVKTIPLWRNRTIQLLKVASVVLLLFGAYSLGRYQENHKMIPSLTALEEENVRVRQTAMVSLMENKSASKRIQGVNIAESVAQPEAEILEALINRLHKDENANVRLAATEALARYTDIAYVKDAFLEALANEKDPTIQITIIEILVRVREKRAVSPMKKIMESENTPDYLKEQLESLIPSLL